jgi:hypothetical protein
METENKRTFPRVNTLNLISFECKDADDVVIQQGMGRTINLSEAGILLETHAPIMPDISVNMSIGFEEELVEIEGKVVYSKPSQQETFETGIKFIEPDESQMTVIRRFIALMEAPEA